MPQPLEAAHQQLTGALSAFLAETAMPGTTDALEERVEELLDEVADFQLSITQAKEAGEDFYPGWAPGQLVLPD